MEWETAKALRDWYVILCVILIMTNCTHCFAFPDYPVPSEYLIHHNIRDKISEFKAATYCDDLLFFLFYFFAGEQMQVYATREL